VIRKGLSEAPFGAEPLGAESPRKWVFEGAASALPNFSAHRELGCYFCGH
jgi:hypothetical protein